jgi:RHS repeat-associated protein
VARAIDLNGDGMSDVWQWYHGIPAHSGAHDADGDGQNNAVEAAFGTNPRSSASHVWASVRIGTGGRRIVSWPSVAGKVYRIERSLDLASWFTLSGEISGTGASLEYEDTSAGSQYFYRARFVRELDTDGDLLTDSEEALLSTSAHLWDTDGDEASDAEEFRRGTDPLSSTMPGAYRLAKTSGDLQSTQGSAWFEEALTVAITRITPAPAAPIPSARVRFEIASGPAALWVWGTGWVQSTEVIADAGGMARIYLASTGASQPIVVNAVLMETPIEGANYAGGPKVSTTFQLSTGKTLPAVPTITLSPDQSEYTHRQRPSFALATTTPGAVLRYTLDGSAVSPESPAYSGSPIPLDRSTRIAARGFLDGVSSGEATRTVVFAAPAGSISVGKLHGLFSTRDGVSWSWGANDIGQLGRGTPSAADVAAASIFSSPTVSATAAGSNFSLLATDAGQVYSFGGNEYGQLGRSGGGSPTPVAIPFLSGVTKVRAGMQVGYAITSGGSVYAWGDNDFGQLGLNPTTTPSRTTPSTISGLPMIADLACGKTLASVSLPSGQRGAHVVAVASNGDVYSWGRNDSGQLGNGTLVSQWQPTRMTSLTQASAVAAGGAHSLVLRRTGEVWSFGSNISGALGQTGEPPVGRPLVDPTPRKVAGLPPDSPIVQVAAGVAFSVVLTESGEVWTWGDGSSGQMGRGTNSSLLVPARVPGIDHIVAVAAGTQTVLALRSDGTLWTWGLNLTGTGNNLSPTQVGGYQAYEDADGDGLPDTWELQRLGTTALDPTKPSESDSDHDGVSTLQEFLNGTDPMNPVSRRAPTATESVPEVSMGGLKDDGEVFQGNIPTQFNISAAGTLNYRVPLDLPKEISALLPLALEYGSQDGPGDAGLGWNLAGLSRITRGPTNLEQDGYYDPIDYDANDVFYLDGNRLLAVPGEGGSTGTYGGNGTEYRTHRDIHARVTSHGALLGAPLEWRVLTRDGKRLTFGSLTGAPGATITLKPDSVPLGGQAVTMWNLRKVEDAFGNYVELQYEKVDEYAFNGTASEANYRLAAIDGYLRTNGGAFTKVGRATFEWQNMPQNEEIAPPSSLGLQRAYLAGSAALVGYVLRTIVCEVLVKGSASDVYYGEDRFARKEYRLIYDRLFYDTLSFYDIIDVNSVYGYAPEWKAMTYEVRPPLLCAILEKQSNARRKVLFDYTRHKPSGARDGYPAASGYDLPVALATSSTGLDNGVRIVDVNADGLPDVVRSVAGSPAQTWINQSNRGLPERFRPAQTNEYQVPVPIVDSATNQSKSLGVYFVDLNGDGLVDIIQGHRSATGTFVRAAYLNNPTTKAWEATAGAYRPPVALLDAQNSDVFCQLADINGDGRLDILQWTKYGTTTNRNTYLNTGTTFSSTPSAAFTPPVGITLSESGGLSTGVHVLDLNGDGYLDIVKARKGTAPEVYLNSALGFGGTTPAYNPPRPLADDAILSTDRLFRWIDLNIDGLPDLLYSSLNPTAVTGPRAYLNTGKGWELAASTNGPPYNNFTPPVDFGLNDSIPFDVTIQDVNGDGLPDFIWAPPTGSKLTWLNSGFSWVATTEPGLIMPLPMTKLAFADLDGDGAPELVERDTTSKKVFTNSMRSPALLSRVIDNMGAQTVVSYQALSASNPLGPLPFYTPNSQGSLPANLRSYIDGRWCVWSVSDSSRVTKYYRYGEMLYDIQRHTPLPFRWYEVADTNTGNYFKTYFHQLQPLIGQIQYVVIFNSAQVKLQETSTYYGTPGWVTPNPGVVPLSPYDVYPSSVIEYRYELDGGIIGSSTTDTVLDSTYGNVTSMSITYADGQQQTTSSTYSNLTTGGKWIVGKPLDVTVTHSRPGVISITRRTHFDHDSTTGALTAEITEPSTALQVRKDYLRDITGNVIKTTISGPDFATRSSRVVYDVTGRFPRMTENALGHRTRRLMDPFHRQPVWVEDANGLRTYFEYDAFGRKTRERRPDGAVTDVACLKVAGSGAPFNLPNIQTAYRVIEKSTGAPPRAEYFDKYGREVSQHSVNGAGDLYWGISSYNAAGALNGKSRPSSNRYDDPNFLGGDADWSPESDIFSNDVKKRMNYRRTADNSTTRLIHRAITPAERTQLQTALGYFNYGQAVEEIKDQLLQTITFKNAKEETIAVKDAWGGLVTYKYDATGNLLETNALGQVTTMTYDLAGRRLSIKDPNQAQAQVMTYNSLGELISTRNARFQTTTMQYDLLGRIIQRVSPEGTSSWVYDSALGAGIGKLAFSSSDSGCTQSITYDSVGRPVFVRRNIQGEVFDVSTTYDTLGRPDRLTYPNGFSVRHQYSAFGRLQRVVDATTLLPYWTAEAYDRWDHVTQSLLGNGVRTTRTYHDLRGWLASITTVDQGNGTIQNLEYERDPFGNLTMRKDLVAAQQEVFSYDALHRLSNSTLNGVLNFYAGYDAKGNVTSRLGLGNYTYAAGNHAVTTIGSGAGAINLGYDGDGNVTTIGARTLVNASFNKPILLTSGPKVLSLVYGDDHALVKEVATEGLTSQTTWHLGSLFQKRVYDVNTQTPDVNEIETSCYIMAGSESIAVRQNKVSGAGSTDATAYLHRDHLGSVTAITSVTGAVLERFSYDAWGKRRHVNGSNAPPIPATSLWTQRAFTDHLELAAFGLIHMGGRLYDPLIGRMLEVDPVVQSPELSQSFNRYAYVGNNPLSFTDPTGMFRTGIGFIDNTVEWAGGKVSEVVNAVTGLAKTAYDTFTDFVTDVAAGGAKAFQKFGKWMENNWRAVVVIAVTVIVTAVVTILTCGTGTAATITLGAAILAGAAGGAAGAATASALSGGNTSDILEAGFTGAWKGALTGAVTWGIGAGLGSAGLAGEAAMQGSSTQVVGSLAANGAAGGVSSGISSVVNGGRFESGFVSGAIAGLASPFIGEYLPEDVFSRAASAAVLGGVTESATGGSFENGAIYGSIQYTISALVSGAAMSSDSNSEASESATTWDEMEAGWKADGQKAQLAIFGAVGEGPSYTVAAVDYGRVAGSVGMFLVGAYMITPLGWKTAGALYIGAALGVGLPEIFGYGTSKVAPK